MVASGMLRQLAFGALDMHLHSHCTGQEPIFEVQQRILSRYELIKLLLSACCLGKRTHSPIHLCISLLQLRGTASAAGRSLPLLLQPHLRWWLRRWILQVHTPFQRPLSCVSSSSVARLPQLQVGRDPLVRCVRSLPGGRQVRRRRGRGCRRCQVPPDDPGARWGAAPTRSLRGLSRPEAVH